MSFDDRLLLRAELRWDDRSVVTRTAKLSPESMLLPVVQAPAIGAHVLVRLSFPKLVEPFDVTGVVDARIHPENPTELPMIRVRLDANDAEAQRKILALVDHEPIPPSTDDRLAYRILIVEDNTVIRDMFAYGVHKYFGRRAGVTVDLAEDGDRGWKLLRDGDYDLAIVDHYLPLVDGAQLISRIRSDERIANLPVVAISVGGEEVREADLRAGADLFLDKPVVLRDLFTTLDRLTVLPLAGGAR